MVIQRQDSSKIPDYRHSIQITSGERRQPPGIPERMSRRNNPARLTQFRLPLPPLPPGQTSNMPATPTSNETLSSSQMARITAKNFLVQFLLPTGTNIQINVSQGETVGTVKNRIADETTELDLAALNKFFISTPMMKRIAVLSEETAPLDSIDYIIECKKSGALPKLRLVEKSKPLTNKEKLRDKEIGALIGKPLCWTDEGTEVIDTRKNLGLFVYELRKNSKQLGSTVNLSGEPPKNMWPVSTYDSQYIKPNTQSKIFVQVIFASLPGKSTTMDVGDDETANSLLVRAFKKFVSSQMGGAKDGNRPEDYIFKIKGLAEYIIGDIPLIKFKFIRDVLLTGGRPEIMFIHKIMDRFEDYKDPSEYDDPLFEPPEANNPSSPKSPKIPDPHTNFRSSIIYKHEDITGLTNNAYEMRCVSIWDMNYPFKIKINQINNIRNALPINPNNPNPLENTTPYAIYASLSIYHGETLLRETSFTTAKKLKPNTAYVSWPSNSYVAFKDMSTCDIPRAARLSLTIFARPLLEDATGQEDNKIQSYRVDAEEEMGSPVSSTSDKDSPIGWVNLCLFDYRHELLCGTHEMKTWKDGERGSAMGTIIQNVNDINNPASIVVEFTSFDRPVVFPTEILDSSSSSLLTNGTPPVANEITRLNVLLNKDPLYIMSPSELGFILNFPGSYIVTQPKALPKFVKAVPYDDHKRVQEFHKLLRVWAPLGPRDALELLDSKFSDPQVRTYAIKCLQKFTNEELVMYLLQLVQVLKYESYHDSSLSRFLLERALGDRRVGHLFYWYLRAQIHEPLATERFGLLLEIYLRASGPHCVDLRKQNSSLKELERIANIVKKVPREEKLNKMKTELRAVKFPKRMQIPLDPSLEADGLHLDGCKIMDSKKMPLWLVWNNNDTDGGRIYTIFKAGDDLRQDMLTLQIFKIMDSIWKQEGLDLLLSIYGCLSTGNEIGFIQVVLNSETTANICKESGYGLKAALKEDPLKNWLEAQNPQAHQFKKAVENFALSCAGYCVATYVLGIGDRHNDNIMVTKDGRLFHIDFGHFLGHFKQKFGVKRERAPFVFTPDYAYVMGGKGSADYNTFVETCKKAYNILRRYSHVFLNLFAMMIGTGLPELQTTADLMYLRKAFNLDMNDKEAGDEMERLINESLTCWTTRVNNLFHLMAHRDKNKKKENKGRAQTQAGGGGAQGVK
eukprot:TRINITY_DN3956_c0_g1_i1.p1 TRINITY_DN3956_c0_g1~~TRINITY_DN3956_c0_g1_i1.p1  ORF type:complete len:1236 (-),score=318.64 TRINITY_DN3956_c0_g1_i1:189-3761(-)